MKHLKILFFSLLFLLSNLAKTQVLTWEPLFSTDADSVTIIYDASQGNAALEGVAPPIYAHTGVITNLSTGPSNWRYVKANWSANLPQCQMQPLGGNLYRIGFRIREYYGVPESEQILQLAFVFRNSNGSVVGRNADGSDIFLPVYQPGLYSAFTQPAIRPLFVNEGETFNVRVQTSQPANIDLQLNNVSVAAEPGTQQLDYEITPSVSGQNWVKSVVSDGITEVVDSFYYYTIPASNVAELPDGVRDGINYINETTVTLVLYAPEKEFVFAVGDFNSWQMSDASLMHQTPDAQRYWVTITGLTPQQEYAFQYLVDGIIRIGDPYCDKILHKSNDVFISEETYPGLMDFPAQAQGNIVSVLQTAQEPYAWQTTDYVRPPKENLVIYELLMRDFLGKHDFATLADTLNYLQNLGVNAIELMPVMEFSGNLSWGYNPIYYCAPDKYYGTKNDLKRVIDECHARGMAVILDMVLNQADNECALVQLYPNLNQSIYFNAVATHPFSVFNDFNHESTATQYFVDRVNEYWITEFRFDGYRFDLSKGFTQTNSGTDVGAWSNYDASRIALLKRMADQIWLTDPNAYVILEHFAANSEEKELSDYGMMLWGNLNYNYCEAAMGWLSNSNFSSISHINRGWTNPHLIGYFESHDEERSMFRNLTYGNTTNPDHNIRTLGVALRRVQQIAAFLYTVPGPKMLWQFGELGYDYSINYPTNTDASRTDPKPIRWDYVDQPERLNLYKTYKALIGLRQYPTFQTNDFSVSASGYAKRIYLNHPDMNAVILGNFDIVSANVSGTFQHTGTWYDYFTGETIDITNTATTLNLAPGMFHIFTDQPLPTPELEFSVGIGPNTDNPENYNYALLCTPNPVQGQAQIGYNLPQPAQVTLSVFTLTGQLVKTLYTGFQTPGSYNFTWNTANNNGMPVAAGNYLYRLEAGSYVETGKVAVLR